MVDGNGQISHFLVNDILRRDGAETASSILPASAIKDAFTGQSDERKDEEPGG